MKRGFWSSSQLEGAIPAIGVLYIGSLVDVKLVFKSDSFAHLHGFDLDLGNLAGGVELRLDSESCLNPSDFRPIPESRMP